MASGSDGGWGRGHFRRRRKAELEAKRAALQEKIDELWDDIDSFEKGISETSYGETVDNAIAKLRDKIDQLEVERDALQEKIDAL